MAKGHCMYVRTRSSARLSKNGRVHRLVTTVDEAAELHSRAESRENREILLCPPRPPPPPHPSWRGDRRDSGVRTDLHSRPIVPPSFDARTEWMQRNGRRYRTSRFMPVHSPNEPFTRPLRNPPWGLSFFSESTCRNSAQKRYTFPRPGSWQNFIPPRSYSVISLLAVSFLRASVTHLDSSIFRDFYSLALASGIRGSSSWPWTAILE